MFIKIPPWDVLVDKFGVDSDGDIGNSALCYWCKSDDELLSSDRIIEIDNTPDKDGDYSITDPRFSVGHLFKVFYAFCIEYNLEPAFGTSRFLRRPYGAD